MKYISAYCLVGLSGQKITSEKVKEVLVSVGVKVDDAKLKQLIEAFKDRPLHEVISAGLKKDVGSVSAAPAGNSSSAPAQKIAEVKKPVEEEKQEEEDVDMGGLFDF